MLDILISSKIKRAILKQFLSCPENKFYVRQIASILNISVGTIHRELIKFEKSGILNSEHLGNLRFFSVNKKNILFNELKQIIFKTEGIKGRLEQELNGIKGIKVAFIYGSFAKNKERASSDVDLFLIGNIDEDELISKISSLEREFSREINYTIYSQEEFKKEKKNKNSFILEIMGDSKIFLIGGLGDL
jgi:predicted nucleotidyltransferase